MTLTAIPSYPVTGNRSFDLFPQTGHPTPTPNIMQRREFLSSVTGMTAGLSLGLPFAFAETSAGGLRIDQPFNGAVLHRRLKDFVVGVVEGPDGKPVALKIKVFGEAPPDAAVTVNGTVCHRNGKYFEAEIELRQKTNEIVVKADSDETRRTVLWLKNSVPRYRFTVDDTIFCLREIHRNGYKSLFDDYFLGNARKLHKKYGTKFALNLFYATSVEEKINVQREPFDLSQFSDRYQSEWRDNADWLQLLFHADKEFPNRPYKDAAPERIISDMRNVEREVKRFAGEQTYLPVNVIHFGEYSASAWKPLYDAGVRVLSNSVSETVERFGMDLERRRYLGNHDFLLDSDSGMVFGKVDMVLNNVPLDRVEPMLRDIVADPNRAEFIDLLTHEQYFWSFYRNYIPDHWDRLDRAFAFVTERGYKPVFINDPPLGLADI